MPTLDGCTSSSLASIGDTLERRRRELISLVLTWLPIMLLGLLVYLIWKTVKLMPNAGAQGVRSSAEHSKLRWEDVAGVDEPRAELMEIVEFLREPERFAALGARVPKGVLLHGPPGTGKTLLARAVAGESGAAFFAQSASSFVEMFVGLGSARIRKLFETARAQAPAIIFIDELDAVGMARSGASFNREADQTLNQLLIELDGFADAAGVVVMASTNRLDHLDPALLRPGRFDRQVLVPPPDIKGRRAILDVHTQGQAARRRRRPRRDRAHVVGPHGRRPREPLQRGRDPRGPRAPPQHHRARLRRRDRAGRRRSPDASRDHREGEADHRLPRGGARADVAPARHDPDAQGVDHPARHGARLRHDACPTRSASSRRARS